MVDSISSRPASPAAVQGAGARRAEQAQTAGTSAPSATARLRDAAPMDGAGAISRSLSEHPPVDYAKVGRLRDAVRAGNYPVSPDRIAEAMVRSLKGQAGAVQTPSR